MHPGSQSQESSDAGRGHFASPCKCLQNNPQSETDPVERAAPTILVVGMLCRVRWARLAVRSIPARQPELQQEHLIQGALLAPALVLAIHFERVFAQRLDRFPLSSRIYEHSELPPNLFLFRQKGLPHLLFLEFQPGLQKVGEAEVRPYKTGAPRRGTPPQLLVAPRRPSLLDGQFATHSVLPQAQQFALFHLLQRGAEPQ